MTTQETVGDSRTIEYVPIDGVAPNEANPKAHDHKTITSSVSRFGVIDLMVVDHRTGKLVSGHGRLASLLAMRDAGQDPPDGVRLDGSGQWMVPTVAGWSSRSDTEAEAALIALNRTTELGGWDDEALLGLLDNLATVEGGLDGVGYDTDDLEELRRSLEELDDGEGDDGEGGESKYTMKVDVPQYLPTQAEPPPVSDLVDTSRTDALLERIAAAQPDLPPEVAVFLRQAAARHTAFSYSRIAEYYAHAPAEVQRLMEDSALVIIDADDAIRNGYLTLSEEMEGIRQDDLAVLAEKRERREELA